MHPRKKPVPNTNNMYLVSEDGNIFSVKKNRNLVPRKHTHGYSRVTIKRKDYYIHRLVAEAFLGRSDLEVNHINGIKTDNRLENLEYVSSKKNKQHAWDNKYYTHQGENHHKSYLTTKQAMSIRDDPNPNMSDIAREWGIPPKTVHNIRGKISWKRLPCCEYRAKDIPS